MLILEHQVLFYENLLSYKARIKKEQIPQMIRSIHNNIDVLNLEICGDIVIGDFSETKEFIIPVNRFFKGNKHYNYKSRFRLYNSIRARHYGSLKDINLSLDILYKYIKDNALSPITKPYYVMRNEPSQIYDIYIGISSNEL